MSAISVLAVYVEYVYFLFEYLLRRGTLQLLLSLLAMVNVLLEL